MYLTIIILWGFGAIVSIYFSIVHFITKEYQFAFFCLWGAAFPPIAFFISAVCYAGLVRYFIYKCPKSFKQFIYDIQTELMIDFLRSKSRKE